MTKRPAPETTLPKSFEEAMAELEGLVRRLESGDIPLDQSIEAYERGMALKKFCEEQLKSAKMRVDQISLNEDGEVGLKPFPEDRAPA
ncbi:MAG: exodeoxyribonuclease VII small subunit [bacterium]|nr:exodeoxyribonuclease VII small subunit [bacterium]